MSAKRSHGLRYQEQSTELTMGRCRDCRTYNPALPGTPKPESCSGCGQPLARDERKVSASRFERKKGRADHGATGTSGGDA